MSESPTNPSPNGLTGAILEARGVTKLYQTRQTLFRRAIVHALEEVSVQVKPGSTVCIVGETGSGKTTLARLLVGLVQPDRGEIRFLGKRIDQLEPRVYREYRLAIQMVFQNPLLSFNPMLTIGGTLRDALRNLPQLDGRNQDSEMYSLLESVGLDHRFAHRYPRQVSGGELQRAGIARALATNPKVVILDEPASALDVSIRGQIFNLLIDLQRERGLAYVLVTHDLQTARLLAEDVVVMYLGKVMEMGREESVLERSRHPYTTALLSATLPTVTKDEIRQRIILHGDIPSATEPPSGCRFHTRCWLYERLDRPTVCVSKEPPLTQVNRSQWSACHFADHLPITDPMTTSPEDGARG